MKSLIVLTVLMAGMVPACASPPERAPAGADTETRPAAAGGWRCPYDIEERDLVEARIGIHDKYDATIPEIVADVAESNRLVEEGIREFDHLNTGKALELHRRALRLYPRNP